MYLSTILEKLQLYYDNFHHITKIQNYFNNFHNWNLVDTITQNNIQDYNTQGVYRSKVGS